MPPKKEYTPKIIREFLQTLHGYKNFKVSYIQTGVSTEVYRLKSPKQTFYFRVGPENENFSSEALAHKLLKEKGVAVPEVVRREDFNKKLGRSYMITAEIKGEPIKGQEKNLKSILFEAGKQLALANSIPVEGFGWIERGKSNVKKLVGMYKSYEEFALDDEKTKNMLKDLEKSGVINSTLSDRYFSFYIKEKSKFRCDKAYLAHGDFSIDHIYHTSETYSGIIDWGDIRAASVYHDLAHFYIYSPNLLGSLLNGFLSIKSLGDNYMKNIEFVAILFALGKLWWVSKNIPERLKKQPHPAITLMKRVLKI